MILEDLFFPSDIRRIKKIKPVVSHNDFYTWNYNKNGDFSVKSAFWKTSQLKCSEVSKKANVQPSTNVLKVEV